MRMRATSRRPPPPAAALAVAAAFLPSPASAAEPSSRALIEISLGALLPAGSWQHGTRVMDPHDEAVSYATMMEPAFVGALRLAYLFRVGDGDACCLLGPELGYSYVAWDPDESTEVDPWSYSPGDLTGARMSFLAAARLMAVWNWGWVLGRLGVGPETSDGSWYDSGGFHGDLGVILVAGTGIGFFVSESIGFTLLAGVLASFHDQAADEANRNFFWGYRSIEFDISAGATFFL